MRRLLLLVWAWVPLAAMPSPTDIGPSAEASVGQRGEAVPGWQQAVFLLKNPTRGVLKLRLGAEALDGQDQVYQRVSREVELPPGAEQRHVLGIFLLPSWSQTVRLSAASGRRELLPEAQREWSGGMKGAPDVPVALALAARDATWPQQIASVQSLSRTSGSQPLRVILADPAAMPQRSETFGSLSAVVCGGFPWGELSEAQMSALAAWVLGGGNLVVFATPEGIPRALARRVPPLQGYRAGARPPGRFPKELRATCQGLAISERDVPCLEGGVPEAVDVVRDRAGDFVQRFRWGFGHVTVLRMDPSAPPLRGDPGMTRIWVAAITREASGWSEPWLTGGDAPHRRRGGGFPASACQPDLCAALRAGLVSGPGTGLVCGLVGGYLLAVALQFLLLRRLGKPAWAVACIPAVVAVFVAGTLATGYATRGLRTKARLITVRSEVPGGLGRLARSYAVAVASVPETWELSVRPGASAAPIFPTGEGQGYHELEEGAPTVLRLRAPMWSAAYAAASAFEAGGVGLAWKDGAVCNTGPRPFERVFVRRRGETWALGALAPGASRRPEEGGRHTDAPLQGKDFGEEAVLLVLTACVFRGDWVLGVARGGRGGEGSLLGLPVDAEALEFSVLDLTAKERP